MYLFFCGLCMGAADLIPGISGGTVAFIMGFYFPLLDSLKSINIQLLFSGRWSMFFQQKALRFLLTVGSGILCSFFLLANFIHYILAHEVYRTYLYSTFLGLILASFYFCIKQIKRWSYPELIGLFAAGALAFNLTNSSFLEPIQNGAYALKVPLPTESVSLTNYDQSGSLLTNLSEQTIKGMLAKDIVKPDQPLYSNAGEFLGNISEFIQQSANSSFLNGWLIFCGAVAICALLLPGISGSYLFTLLGVYPLIIGSLADWVTHIKSGVFDWSSFEVLLNVVIGIVAGIALFSHFLTWLLKNYCGITLATLSGFMFGALRSVWPFWSYSFMLDPLKLEKGPQLQTIAPIWPETIQEVFVGVVFAMSGFALVLTLEALSSKKVKNLGCEVKNSI